MGKKGKKTRKQKNRELFFTVLGVFLIMGTAGLFMYQRMGSETPQLPIAIETETTEPDQIVWQPEEDVTVPEPVYTGKYGEMMADAQRMQEENAHCFSNADADTVTLRFAGDVLLDPGYSVMSALKNRNMDVNSCFSPSVLELMRSADVFMLNNEFTYTDRGEPLPNKMYTFRTHPENVAVIKDMGTDIVSVANNHISDFGEVSLLDTLDTLDGAGIPYVGAGRNLKEASRPIYYMSNDLKVGYLCATQIERLVNPDTRGATETSPGTMRCLEPDLFADKIRETKKNCDFLVVYIHWGQESVTDVDFRQTEQAKLFAEAGADLIIGAHPHILQGLDYAEDTPVFYSLGNYWFNSKNLDTMIVEAQVGTAGLQSVRVIPCIQQNCSVLECDEANKLRIINSLREMSHNVAIDDEGYVSKP